MDFFNWFPVDTNMDKYEPLTVKIEIRPVEASNTSKEADNKEIIEPSLNKVQETEARPVDQYIPKEETTPVVSSSDTDFDPYADLGINNYSNSSLSEPEPIEEGVLETPFIPTGQNIIELEAPVAEDSNQSSDITKEPSVEPGVSVLSDNEFIGLEQSITKENDRGSSESIRQSDSDSDLFEYRDSPVKFENPGVKRELLTNPPPEIPDDLPPDFPPRSTYIIRFSLNSDGLIQVLSISPIPLYPRIDASIRKALRSWTFTRSSGSEHVKGTITLIFRGK